MICVRIIQNNQSNRGRAISVISVISIISVIPVIGTEVAGFMLFRLFVFSCYTTPLPRLQERGNH